MHILTMSPVITEVMLPAQGHHPMAFALAELVDNSLRATRGRTTSDRNIRVTLVLHPERSEGLVSVSRYASSTALLANVGSCGLRAEHRGHDPVSSTASSQQVWDNGEGMTAEGLRQWAVMNLSMEDRGMQPTQPPDAGDSGAGSFLDAQLSFFGVRFPRVRLFSGAEYLPLWPWHPADPRSTPFRTPAAAVMLPCLPTMPFAWHTATFVM